jgi:uncharacterized small protein (DUF1192 family)
MTLSLQERMIRVGQMRAEVRRLKGTGLTTQEAQRSAAKIIEERFRPKKPESVPRTGETGTTITG